MYRTRVNVTWKRELTSKNADFDKGIFFVNYKIKENIK